MESTTPTARLRRAVVVADEIEMSDVFMIHEHDHDFQASFSRHNDGSQGTMMVLEK